MRKYISDAGQFNVWATDSMQEDTNIVLNSFFVFVADMIYFELKLLVQKIKIIFEKACKKVFFLIPLMQGMLLQDINVLSAV